MAFFKIYGSNPLIFGLNMLNILPTKYKNNNNKLPCLIDNNKYKLF